MMRFFKRGLGRGRNSTKTCTCPKCGHVMQSQRGVPCTEIECPKCGTKMRGDLCI
jgi:hypothetical protein